MLSVVIPVYGTEEYLPHCIDSVLAQNFEEMEIVLVDDGSSDGCPGICDAYVKRDARINVIHKPNMGLSSARNAGIHAARGSYLMFIDSDDEWNSSVELSTMLDKISGDSTTEMVLFSGYDIAWNGVILQRREHERLREIREDLVRHYYCDLLKNGNLEVSACTKILKTDFLQKYNLYFKEGLLGEDNEWMIRVLRCLNVVRVIPEPLYLCRQRQGSITHTIGTKNVFDMLEIIQWSTNYWSSAPISHEIEQLEKSFDAYLWFCALGLSADLPAHEKRALKPMFQATSSVCVYSMNKKTKLAKAAYSLFGLRGSSFLMGQYIKLRGRTKMGRTEVSG